MKKSVPFFVFTFIVFSFVVSAIAQESETSASAVPTLAVEEERLTIETKDKGNPAAKNLKLSREFRRRLPNGFAAVVDNVQREKIYSIQREYYEVIELLRLRIELLESERNSKIGAVLTSEQAERVKRSTQRALRSSQR